jgi:hypothetical protein
MRLAMERMAGFLGFRHQAAKLAITFIQPAET